MLTSMAADATTILNAVKAVLTGLYAAVPVYESKRAAVRGKNPESGWQAGFKVPCFVISCGDPEPIDKRGTFTQETVEYPVLVEYVWVSQAVIASPPNVGSPVGVEDPAIRDIRDAIRAALYKPYLVSNVTRDVTTRMQKPYEIPQSTGEGRLVASGEQFTYLTTVTRPSPR